MSMTFFNLDFEKISSPPTMCTIAVVMALCWTIILEISKKMIFNALPNTGWWHRAVRPTTQMMQNFGYPKTPNEKFPNAVTESMARDFYAFLTTLCVQHFLSALPMIPVLYYGWEASSDTVRSLFLLGTLSDVGFDIYDSIKSSIRTFTKHPDPLPIDFWVVITAMHHTMALALFLPMNIKYIYMREYHQTAVSLLLAAALCYGAGNYKFTLDINKYKDFIKYKCIVLFQLAIILYTRVYLWFPTAKSTLAHFYEQKDMTIFNGACFILFIFSIFNLMLVADGLKGAIKWIPKKFPQTTKDTEKAIEDSPGLGVPLPSTAFEAIRHLKARRKFKGAVNTVIAANRLKMMNGDSVQY